MTGREGRGIAVSAAFSQLSMEAAMRRHQLGTDEEHEANTGVLDRNGKAADTDPADDLPPPIPGHPLAPAAGAFANSPSWNAVMEEMERRRQAELAGEID
jgi:hypothetical protein